jgi:hypothetical protein
MSRKWKDDNTGFARWRYLLLVALLLVLAAAMAVGLWQLPRTASPANEARPTTVADTSYTEPTQPSTPRPTSPPTEEPTMLAGVLHPTITEIRADVEDEAGTITFHMEAEVPAGRRIEEVLLWYDTEIGHAPQRTAGPLTQTVTLSYKLDTAQEGLTRTLTTTGELDYWWLARDTAGESVRAGGTAMMGPALKAMVVVPSPEPPRIDHTWSISESKHFRFHYMPDTAAARDLNQLGRLAEATLPRTSNMLGAEFDAQMSIYLIPRIFWQGGAAYSGKVQLISYLDRNYTAIETWSYFAHEGTHALAQDLLQPKENGGGPDGVLVEGLAVWASDGHYRQEPIDSWAAVVADSDEYIPLSELRAGPFYDFQHETSYLEAASFVKFLVAQDTLDKFKELYGLATGEDEHDEALVEELYGKGYATLEKDWLEYLDSLYPAPEQAETWRLKVRAFDLMRRYQTELDPDARILPDTSPSEWTTDTLKIFLHRLNAPTNVVLETTFIEAQERLSSGELNGAAGLLDDIEAALDAGSSLDRPTLRARQAILDLIAEQDRAVLRADVDGYRDTLDPDYARRVGAEVKEALQAPYTAYRQEMVRLSVTDDGLRARGTVLVHSQLADGVPPEQGTLYALTFVTRNSHWLMGGREPLKPTLSLPPPRAN